jgi:RNA polymerase sigma-70 factor (ECF subfamily)
VSKVPEGTIQTVLSLLNPQASLAPISHLARAVNDPSPSAPSDDFETLVSAAVNGDPAAIDGVIRRIRPLVLRYCRARVGMSSHDFGSADDLAQEVCLAVLTALPSYRDQGRPFLAFVYGIAAHKVADAHRSAARNRTEPVPDVPDSTDLAEGPEAQVTDDEFGVRFTKWLELVSDRQREILRLRIVIGLSVEETAEAVGSTPGAVRVAQHRALNRLRDLLTAKPSAGGTMKAATPSSTGTDTLSTGWTAQPSTGPDRVERFEYARFTNSLARTLDLRGGLAETVGISCYTAMSQHISNLLNLEAGLEAALLTMSARAEPPPGGQSHRHTRSEA